MKKRGMRKYIIHESVNEIECVTIKERGNDPDNVRLFNKYGNWLKYPKSELYDTKEEAEKALKRSKKK